MSEVPHCPDCRRADKVKTTAMPRYTYYCRNCDRTIEPNEIEDVAFIDMVSKSMFRDYDDVAEQARPFYSDGCECQWCERGRPALDKSMINVKGYPASRGCIFASGNVGETFWVKAGSHLEEDGQHVTYLKVTVEDEMTHVHGHDDRDGEEDSRSFIERVL